MKGQLEVLEQVKSYAGDAHSGQTRKYTPDPYIVHPIRVMEICKNYTNDLSILAAALLHDVLEDTDITEKQMQDYLNSIMTKEDAKKTLRLVVELTDVYVKKNYPQWNRRKRKSMEVERMEKTSSEAQTIKYADIIDNSAEIGSHDPDFGRVYLYESRALLRKINKGNQELYKKAMETIETCLTEIDKSRNS